MHAQAQAYEALNMRELLGEARTDTVTGMTSSSSVTSQTMRPLMLRRSHATAAVPGLHVHASSRLSGTRSSSSELALLQDGIAQSAINLS
jgi:hypothetical protein